MVNNKKITETLKIDFATKNSLKEQIESFVESLGGYVTSKGRPSSLYHGEITIYYMMSLDDASEIKVIEEIKVEDENND